MSLPLHDLGNVKVSQATHSLLRAKAMGKRMDVSAFAREILDQWASDELHIFSMANEIHKSKELGEITSSEGRL
jgi:hypothetical protein